MKAITRVGLFAALALAIGFSFQNCGSKAGFVGSNEVQSQSSNNDKRSCSIAGQVLANGQTILMYAEAHPAAGVPCASQTRACDDGSLSGSYTSTTCQATSISSGGGTTSSCWTAGNPLCNIGACGNNYQLCPQGGCAEPADAQARATNQYCCSNRYRTTFTGPFGESLPKGYAYCE